MHRQHQQREQLQQRVNTHSSISSPPLPSHANFSISGSNLSPSPHSNNFGHFPPPLFNPSLHHRQHVPRGPHLVSSGRLQPPVEEEASESGVYDDESTYLEDTSSFQDEETSELSEMSMPGRYALAGRRKVRGGSSSSSLGGAGRRKTPYFPKRGGNGGGAEGPLQWLAAQALAQALAQAGIAGRGKAALRRLAAGGTAGAAAPSPVAPGAVRCVNWPTCEFGNRCRYHHPSEMCKFFPHCRETGATCMYIHPSIPCPQGKACEDGARCNYSHPPAAVSDAELAASAPRINKDCKFGEHCLLPATCPYRHPDRELEVYFRDQGKQEAMSN
jgi:hypothetical protein